MFLTLRRPRKKRSTELEGLKIGMKALDQDWRTDLKKCNCLNNSLNIEMFADVRKVMVPEDNHFTEVIVHFSDATDFNGAVTDDIDNCLCLV